MMSPTVWRESASLILASRSGDGEKIKQTVTSFDYKVLLVKRSERTAYATNHCVFPGGIFESADESVEWLKYFQEFGVPVEKLRELVITSGEQRPQILAPRGTGCYDRFFECKRIWAREISLRLTAIRETFEEVGILLCCNKEQLKEPRGYVHVKDNIDKHYWQQAVHKDPNEFLRMCRELQVVPDLWGLYEWSAWASPAIVPKGFETVFFTAFVPSIPHILAEEAEIKEFMWESPTSFMRSYIEQRIYLMPPQVYELCRLIGVQSYDNLFTFTQRREPKGTTLYMPVAYMCTDGPVAIYPGDDAYPPDPRSCQNMESVELTVAEFRTKSKRLHRVENFIKPPIVPQLNSEAPNGHLPPVALSDAASKL